MRRPYTQHGSRHARMGSDPIPGLSFGRIVYGQVANSTTGGPDSDGILDPGSGDWTVTGDDSGNWTITFDPAYENVPAVVVSENDDTTDPPSFIRTGTITVGTVDVVTYEDTGGVSNDIGFNFIAIGPA